MFVTVLSSRAAPGFCYAKDDQKKQQQKTNNNNNNNNKKRKNQIPAPERSLAMCCHLTILGVCNAQLF